MTLVRSVTKVTVVTAAAFINRCRFTESAGRVTGEVNASRVLRIALCIARARSATIGGVAIAMVCGFIATVNRAGNAVIARIRAASITNTAVTSFAECTESTVIAGGVVGFVRV